MARLTRSEVDWARAARAMKQAFAARIARIGLAFSVHLEAFWRFPVAYLTAVKWRVLRKRERSRGHFAVILGQASLAYEWRNAIGGNGMIEPSPPGFPPIIALVCDGGTRAELEATLASLASEQIVAHLIGPNPLETLGQIATEMDWASGPLMLPLSAGDCVAAGAAQSYRAAIEGSSYRVVYADDDQINAARSFSKPHFKPDWNAELFRHHDYLVGSCVVRAGRAALLAAAKQPDWAAALISTAVAEGGGAYHLHQVLHHRLSRPAPRLPLPPVSLAPDLPRVSVIVPTRNRADLLATCIAGLETADYPDLEVIIVDNDSDDPATLAFLGTLPERARPGLTYQVLRHPGPFNYSAINNRAASEASGELICLLNNDIAMLRPDWLAIMATQALREEIGAVGAQLLYPDGRIQHAGVVIGVGNAAGHAHRFLRPEQEGYFHRHALPQFVSAVTAACLVVRRERFLAVGGLDEVNFPVAFNDVDLCLRLNARGWQSFYEPRAVLVHHESVSRGFDRDPVGAARFAKELAALQRLWHTDQVTDPFHHPYLSRAAEQFALAL